MEASKLMLINFSTLEYVIFFQLETYKIDLLCKLHIHMYIFTIVAQERGED